MTWIRGSNGSSWLLFVFSQELFCQETWIPVRTIIRKAKQLFSSLKSEELKEEMKTLRFLPQNDMLPFDIGPGNFFSWRVKKFSVPCCLYLIWLIGRAITFDDGHAFTCLNEDKYRLKFQTRFVMHSSIAIRFWSFTSLLQWREAEWPFHECQIKHYC